MARTDTLEHYLTDVADAIRAKSGTSGEIQASSFDTAIANIPSGNSYTGSYDTTGLANLGWTTSEINDYKDYVYWDEGEDNAYKITAEEIASKPYSATVATRWYPHTNEAPSYSNFSGYSNLYAIPKSKIDTSTANTKLFYSCYGLITCPPLNLSNYTSTYQMFYMCYSLKRVPQLNVVNVTNASNMFINCRSLKDVDTLTFTNITDASSMFSNCYCVEDLSKVTIGGSVNNASSMFSYCYELRKIPTFTDTSHIQNASSMFNCCYQLAELPLLDFSSVYNISSAFASCYKLSKVGGFKDYGKGIPSDATANASAYKLTLSSSPLSHESLLNIANNLYDIATAGIAQQTVSIGTTNKAKLTAEEQAIFTNKGWKLS